MLKKFKLRTFINSKKSMRQFTFVLFILILSHVCYGQTDIEAFEKNILPESFINLTDTLVKEEIAMFNFKGTLVKASNSFRLSTLKEIPLRGFDSKYLSFYIGSTFISIYFKQNTNVIQELTNNLDSIFFVTHSHFRVRIPKSAFIGLPNTISCEIIQGVKKKIYSNPFFKVFQSYDNRRIYIYMIGSLSKKRYEVTWVIKSSKFYCRTIDSL